MRDFAFEILNAHQGKLCLFSVGQAGFIIKSKSGQLLGLDLYLSECVERLEGHMGFKRLLPKILNPMDLTFDCLIATHPHWDHFDVDAVPQLISNNRTKLFASLDCCKEMVQLGLAEDRATYVTPDERHQWGDFSLDFVRCDHGTSAPDAFGVVIEVDGKKLYFAGDTCLHRDWAEFYKGMGHIHVMAAAINGHFGNLNEQDCADLGAMVCPDVLIPCHYGMFASHGGDPGVFMEIMNRDYPEQKYLLMRMGECFEIDE